MKKMATLTALVLMAAMITTPAMAGVGGCGRAGVGGCGSGTGGWQAKAPTTQQDTPTVLERLHGAVPLQVFVMLNVIFAAPQLTPEQPTVTEQGVGGCGRAGVGGCGGAL